MQAGSWFVDFYFYCQCTPLHIAVGSQQAGTVQLLLAHKANPYVQDLEGRYPLHIAASDGSDTIIEILVKASKENISFN